MTPLCPVVCRDLRMLAAFRVIWGRAVISWPLTLTVTSCRGLRARMTRLMLIPVASWR